MPPPTLTRSQVRDVDRRAIDEYGLPGVVLMENAGRGAVDLLCRERCSGPVLILAGKGNNGGDGFVMARHLAIRGIEARVILCCNASQLQGDAAIHYHVLHRAGLAGIELGNNITTEQLVPLIGQADWIVDALLGTGAQGDVREPYRTAIEAINRSGSRVLAVDLPSGMDCDTGVANGICVRANLTATFVARKPGFDAVGADQFTGRVEVIDIGVPPRLLEELTHVGNQK
ncbi:MAG: nnr 2 [Planctomycetaceae bacterium]|nr:nnr 2 [Planctomycetaceae bacterium]